MKKLFLLGAVAMLLSLTACEKKACYEFTIVTTSIGNESTNVVYVYCTEEEAEVYKNNYSNTMSSCTFKKTAKSEGDCMNDL